MEGSFNSADSSSKLVEKILHNSLRLCSGALRSTLITCLRHQCNEMPVKIKFEQLCLYYIILQSSPSYIYIDADHPTSAVVFNITGKKDLQTVQISQFLML